MVEELEELVVEELVVEELVVEELVVQELVVEELVVMSPSRALALLGQHCPGRLRFGEKNM